MIRPFTCICIVLAAGSGLYLYQTKHRAQLLDREIARTYKQIDQTKDRIGILTAEWALLNEPDRLQDLAQQHLALKTLAPTQFAALGDLGNRLPAPLPPGTVILPSENPVPPAAPIAAPAAAPVPMAAAKPAAATSRTFAANDKAPEKAPDKAPDKTLDKAPDKLAEKPADKPAAATPTVLHTAARAPTVVASAAPAPRPMPPPVPVAQAQPVPLPPAPHIMAPVMNVSAQEAGHAVAPGTVGESVARAARNRNAASTIQPMILPANSVAPSYAAPAYPQPSFASALGGAGHVALPAPVPYGAPANR